MRDGASALIERFWRPLHLRGAQLAPEFQVEDLEVDDSYSIRRITFTIELTLHQ